ARAERSASSAARPLKFVPATPAKPLSVLTFEILGHRASSSTNSPEAVAERSRDRFLLSLADSCTLATRITQHGIETGARMQSRSAHEQSGLTLQASGHAQGPVNRAVSPAR